MRAISFKNTALFKRGIWLSAIALILFVGAPSVLNGNLWKNPLPSAIAIGILCAALIYFFWNTQVHRLADEVLDCGDHLKVRRGRIEETISLSQVSAVEVSSSSGFHRIALRLIHHVGNRWRIDNELGWDVNRHYEVRLRALCK